MNKRKDWNFTCFVIDLEIFLRVPWSPCNCIHATAGGYRSWNWVTSAARAQCESFSEMERGQKEIPHAANRSCSCRS